MKTKVIMAGAAIIMSAVAVGFSANTNNRMTDFMSANLEALTISEAELAQKIWIRYDYTNDNGTPGVNCVKGGTSDCIIHM